MSNPNHLFAGNYLSQALEVLRQEIPSRVSELSDALIFSEEQTVAVTQVYEKITIEPLVIYFDKAEMLPGKEIEKEWISMFGDRGGYQKAIRIDILIPFSGDKELFKLRPSTFTTIWPTGTVKDNDLRLRFEYFTPDPNYSIKKNYEDQVGLLRQYAEWINKDIDDFNSNLKPYITRSINQRRQELETNRSKVSELGLPIRTPTQSTATPIETQTEPKKKVVLSENCRHIDVIENGQKISEDFTPAQAQIIKYLTDQHKQGLSKCHYKEILQHVETNAIRLQDVFKLTRNNKTVKHPLFGVFIKNDGNGNYWLDL